LTLYVNGSASDALIDYAIRQSRYPLVRVDDYRTACLTIVFPSTYQTLAELSSSLHWHGPWRRRQEQEQVESDGVVGQNHLLWQYSRFTYQPRMTADNAFQWFDVGMAAVASEALEHAHLRAGYDMSLPLPTKFWKRNNETMDVTTRPLLLQFRGAVQSTDQVGYHHRWLAGTYWEEADDVAVDVQCLKKKHWPTRELTVTKPYEFPATFYRVWMETTVYGFAPGGSGPGSYRFGEILYAGGIPIVTDNFVPPLFPEVDWTDCLIVISSYDDVVNLPTILRQRYNDPSAIRRRQMACARLLRTVIGTSSDRTSDNDRVTFTRAMEIWYLRVQHALEYSDYETDGAG
jgi:hypothetical protein